jgi:hypothetical protein
MKYDLKAVVKNFKIDGTFSSAEPFGAGHINDSFLVRTAAKASPDYLLQRINHHVFKNVPALMSNIARVTEHLRKKLLELPNSNPDRECLRLVPANDDKAYHQDDAGNYWRIYLFIDDSRCYDRVDSPAKAREGGRAFGKFQAMVSDLPGAALYDTIPDFHNIEKRLEIFFGAVKADPLHRVKEASREVAMVEARAEEMLRIVRLGAESKIPQRITHNDTKFNNVLLDRTGKALCVTDLDTVMSGYVHYDFGDAVRTAANAAAEDEKELDKVKLDIELFAALAQGFLEETRSFLTETEMDTLAFSGKLLAFTIGLRFLADYIDGDKYYKIHFKNHNLQRARAQFKLLASMDEQYDEMQAIVKSLMNQETR